MDVFLYSKLLALLTVGAHLFFGLFFYCVLYYTLTCPKHSDSH